MMDQTVGWFLLACVLGTNMIVNCSSVPKEKLLDCSPTETKIDSRYTYEENGPECGDLITEPNDPYNMEYRQECQRWLQLPTLPDIVNTYFIYFCEKFSNGTTKYRSEVCCEGATVDQVCFECYNYTSSDYNCAYGGAVTTCAPGQVCQSTTRFYNEYPNTDDYKSTFCADEVACDTDEGTYSEKCQQYIPAPECHDCCSTPFCNLDTPDYNRWVAYDACVSNPCYSGGTCHLNGTWNYYCECRPGYTGDRCQISPPSPCSQYPCKNGAICSNSGDDYICYCQQGWGGQNCTDAYPECTDQSYCMNGGTCIDHGVYGLRCRCPVGFAGSLCEFPQLICFIPEAYYNYTNSYWQSMSTTNCTDRVMYEQINQVDDSSAMSRCRSHMASEFGNPQFEDNVDGEVNELESASLSACAKGEIYGWRYEEYCCPTCYSTPCENNAWCIQASDDDYICKCRFGWEGRNCQNRNYVCLVTGDPHYNTFDGASLHYQGSCKYQLAASDESFPSWESFLVVGKNRRDPPPALQTVSLLEYMEISVFDHVVRLDQGKEAYVDDVLVTPQVDYPGFSILYNGPNVRLETNFSLIVEFDGLWTGVIKLPPPYFGTNQGICGDADGNPDNDIRTKEGLDVRNITNRYSTVGNSWQVDDETNPNCTKEDTDIIIECHPVIEDLIETNEYCGLIVDTLDVFGPCIANENVLQDMIFENCLYDVCAVANDTEAMKYVACRTLEAFVLLCQSHGHVTDWRDTAGCPMFCPNGTVYQFSAPACPATCEKPDAPEECPLPNTEGCVCPDNDMVWSLKDGCENATSCGCVDTDDVHYEIGDTWIEPDCTYQHICVPCTACTRPIGEIISVPFTCPTEEICDGNGQCEDNNAPKCTDSDGTKYPVGYTALTTDCSKNITCTLCDECIPPVGNIHKQDHACPVDTQCHSSDNITGTCVSILYEVETTVWDAWTPWSQCLYTKHHVWIHTRTRKCLQPSVVKGRATCQGPAVQHQSCGQNQGRGRKAKKRSGAN